MRNGYRSWSLLALICFAAAACSDSELGLASSEEDVGEPDDEQVDENEPLVENMEGDEEEMKLSRSAAFSEALLSVNPDGGGHHGGGSKCNAWVEFESKDWGYCYDPYGERMDEPGEWSGQLTRGLQYNFSCNKACVTDITGATLKMTSCPAGGTPGSNGWNGVPREDQFCFYIMCSSSGGGGY